MTILDNCGICGERVSLQAKAGRLDHLKGVGGVEIPSDFEIPTCENCGAEWIDSQLHQKLEDALKTSFEEKQLRDFIEGLKLAQVVELSWTPRKDSVVAANGVAPPRALAEATP